MKADKIVDRKQARKKMSNIFKSKVKCEKRIAWRHNFVCLAYRGQDKIPTTDYQKEELYQAGLGEKEIIFESLDLSQQEFKDLILKHYPRLKDGGGFQLLKG